MEKARQNDEHTLKVSLDAVHDALDSRVSKVDFEEIKRVTAGLTRGVVKFAQVRIISEQIKPVQL